MMRYKLARLFAAVKTVALDEKAKSAMRRKLSGFIQAHPPVKPLAAWSDFTPSASRWKFLFLHKAAAAGLAVLVLFVGSTAWAAESALPGDWLYSVKLKFNEPLRGTMVFTPAAQVQWEEQKAERRLAEVESLLVAGRLGSAEIEASAQNFEAQIGLVRRQIERLSAADDWFNASEARSDFSARLSAHREILKQLDARQERTEAAKREKTRAFIETVGRHSSAFSSSSAAVIFEAGSDGAAPQSSRVRAEERNAAASQTLRRAQADLERARRKGESDNLISVEAGLAAVNDRLQSANEDFEAGNFEQALNNFSEVRRISGEAEVFIKAGLRLRVPLDFSGSVSPTTTAEIKNDSRSKMPAGASDREQKPDLNPKASLESDGQILPKLDILP